MKVTSVEERPVGWAWVKMQASISKVLPVEVLIELNATSFGRLLWKTELQSA